MRRYSHAAGILFKSLCNTGLFRTAHGTQIASDFYRETNLCAARKYIDLCGTLTLFILACGLSLTLVFSHTVISLISGNRPAREFGSDRLGIISDDMTTLGFGVGET